MMMGIYPSTSIYFLGFIGEQVKRTRHNQGCTIRANAVCVYIFMEVSEPYSSTSLIYISWAELGHNHFNWGRVN